MARSTILWGTAFAIGGVLVAGAWLPGADAWALGPRIGIASLCLMVSFLLFATWATQWFLAASGRNKDGGGSCPVGRVCPACGAFTFYPKSDCKACGADLSSEETLGIQTEPL